MNDGTIYINDEANEDWLRAARLKRRAKQGDAEAAAELQRRFATKMRRIRVRDGESEDVTDDQ